MWKKKYIILNTKCLLLALFQKRDGQSLIEVLIGLTIGALLIGAAAMGIAFMLRSTSTNDNLQMASGMAQSSIDKVRAFSGADWQNIYGLTKGTSTSYYLAASSTRFFVVEGKEGVVGNDITNGLMGRWGFDEATGTVAYDMSGNGINGNFINNPIRATSTCVVGYCMNFAGSSNISSSNANFKYTTGTFSYWAKFNQKNVTGGLFHLYEGSTTDYIRSYIDSGNQMDLVIEDDNAGKISVRYDMDNLGDFPGNWFHVAWTQDGSSVKLYVNGEERILTGTNSGSWWTSHLLNNLSMRFGYAWAYFDGWLDDFRIYNRALSADEVKQLYESPAFSRYFTVEDVCRTNDASSTISGVTPCETGSVDDPSTQRVTSIVEWASSGNITDLALVDYITRWKNAVFQQTDWLGGSGDENVYTQPGTTYASSTNIDLESGSIRIHNL